MKKSRTAKKPRQQEKEMLPEYRFDYSKARPNRFAARLKQGSRVVVIEPDVAEVFVDPKSINAVLRALIETMPAKPGTQSKRAESTADAGRGRHCWSRFNVPVGLLPGDCPRAGLLVMPGASEIT